MRFGRLLRNIILIIAIIAGIYFVKPYINVFNEPDLEQYLSAEPLSFDSDGSLYFFKDGFIITGDNTRYYDWDRTEMLPPFKQDDLAAEGGKISIKLSTENHIVTENGRIYNTAAVPFNMIYENREIDIWDIKEFSDFLLLLVKQDENKIMPMILVQNSTFLISLDDLGGTEYLTADGFQGTKDLSVLALSVDSSVPISRVFSYINRNEPYAVVALENELFYDAIRLKNYIVLIGIDNILCYNIDGHEKWSVMNTTNGLYEIVETDKGVLLYTQEIIKSDKKSGNAILISGDGSYSVTDFPKYLSKLQWFKNGYIGLEYQNTLVFMDKKGKVEKKQRLSGQYNWLGTTEYDPDSLYLRTKDGTLEIYSTASKKDDDK